MQTEVDDDEDETVFPLDIRTYPARRVRWVSRIAREEALLRARRRALRACSRETAARQAWPSREHS